VVTYFPQDRVARGTLARGVTTYRKFVKYTYAHYLYGEAVSKKQKQRKF
jgi:hypothetical protein